MRGHQADGAVTAELKAAPGDPHRGSRSDQEHADRGERAVTAQQVPGESGGWDSRPGPFDRRRLHSRSFWWVDGSTVRTPAAGHIGQTLRSAARPPYLGGPGGHTGGVSRRISSPELIGRAAEVAALGAALADARCGQGRLVLVEGDAGIGKTRLVEEFTANVDGVRVLAGGGIPLASDTPYALVLGILQALARLHPPAAGGLLPQDAPVRADPFGRTRLLAAAADAVRVVAAETPLVLVVEDLHWADASTRGLVSFLARVIRADPVLLVVTVRAEELDPARPVSVLIGELARMPHAERLALAPLDSAGVAALVEAITGVAPSARLTGRLVQRAAGNPFFTEELLAAGPDALTLPASVGDVLAERVVRLPAAGQRVLGAASVLGRAVSHQLLAAVAEAADLDDGLATAVSHRLLEPWGDGYRFRHPLIQETLYGRLLPAARQALHARAAAALTELRPPEAPAGRAGHAVQVAFHWQQAGRDRKALAAAVRAGDLARAAYAPAEALAQYTLAIAGWQNLPDPQAAAGVDEISLLERAAEAASAAGDNARAQELVQRVLARTDPAAEPVRAALRLERLGRFSWLAGDLATSRRAYEDALRVIPDQPSPTRARVLAATAQSLMLQSQHLSSRGYAEQSVAVARAVGARAEEAHARNTLGTALAALGCHADGIEMIRAGLQLARQIGDGTEAARCHLNLTDMLAEARQPEEALRAGEEGIREATALGLGRVHAAAILGSVLEALYLLGRWDEIQARASAALDGPGVRRSPGRRRTEDRRQHRRRCLSARYRRPGGPHRSRRPRRRQAHRVPGRPRSHSGTRRAHPGRRSRCHGPDRQRRGLPQPCVLPARNPHQCPAQPHPRSGRPRPVAPGRGQ